MKYGLPCRSNSHDVPLKRSAVGLTAGGRPGTDEGDEQPTASKPRKNRKSRMNNRLKKAGPEPDRNGYAKMTVSDATRQKNNQRCKIDEGTAELIDRPVDKQICQLINMNWPHTTASSKNPNYVFASRPNDRWPVRVLVGLGLLFMAGFAGVYVQPASRGEGWLFGLLSVSVGLKLLRLLHEWYHYWQVRPVGLPPVTRTWRVDVLTTYCPGEPIDMVVNTLRAIQAIRYPHTTFLCDEANDPYLRQVCAELGIYHIARSSRTDAKAGNINHALQYATGEICLILDPDHIPVPDFLDQVLPHFEDPGIGFVPCVQGYYNRKESVVALAAAEQTYSFYGPMMTCMSQYGTAQAIGANCTFRRAALDSIGGHAAGLSEDMHTAMHLHATGWRSVYVPLPLSFGQVPATLSAYYKQQLKWARGTLELLVTTYPRVFGGLTWRQRLHYLTMPLHYLLGVSQFIDLLLPVLALLLLRLPLHIDLLTFGIAYLPLMLTAFLIRQYAQRWLIERHEAGFHILGGVLAAGTWWVYLLGLVYTIFRVEVPYLPTPKNDRPRNHFWLILPNLLVMAVTGVAIAYSVYHYGRFTFENGYMLIMIAFSVLNMLIVSITMIIGQERALLALKRWLGRVSRRWPVVRAFRRAVWVARYGFYGQLRQAALPLFALVVVLTTGLLAVHEKQHPDPLPVALRHANTQSFYYGLSPAMQPENRPPRPASGERVIVPQSVSWPATPALPIPAPVWPGDTSRLPLLYLEPDLPQPRSEIAIAAFLRQLNTGQFDAGIRAFLAQIRQHRKSVLVGFAPEFDSEARAWGSQQTATLVAYRRAYERLVKLGRQQRLSNLIWVWCPARPATLAHYAPDSETIDWLGLSIADPPGPAALPPDAGVVPMSFATRYQQLHNRLRLHPNYYIRQKPVLITATDSPTGPLAKQPRWLADALLTIRDRYPEVRGLLLDKSSVGWRGSSATDVSPGWVFNQ
jgi:cellulose synthase (UDP-forming)